ncbi:MAG: alpha/beta fold hydrolase [Acidimicrobiia bacterium]|nr:alpha/beta fold hydrolase [Acidimicrobiia bacterium]
MSELATPHGALWVRHYGNPPAQVIALHGFTLHGGMFAKVATATNAAFAAPDLPGHGRSKIEPVRMTTAVAAVASLLATSPKPPLLLGYSQGGRVALQAALAHPTMLRGLVLVSTSPGLTEPDRSARRTADNKLADRIERIGIEQFVDEWLQNPMTSNQNAAPADRSADRALRLENTASGLAAALRGMGQAAVGDSAEELASLPIPVVCVAGERDEKYTTTAWSMARSRGEQPVIVSGSGHNIILEAPHAIANVVNGLIGAGINRQSR